MPQTVWVLSIEHRHGADTFVCATKEIAINLLAEYVKEWWESELSPEPLPADHLAMIDAYFDHVENEFHTLEELAIIGG